MTTIFGELSLRQYQLQPESAKQPSFSVARDLINPRPCQVKRRHIAPLSSVVMSSVTPVTYAEFYRVVTNDPNNCDPSAM